MDDASKPLRPRPSLRLVTNDETPQQEILSPESPLEPEKPKLKSALASRLTLFADDLDKQIALLLAQ